MRFRSVGSTRDSHGYKGGGRDSEDDQPEKGSEGPEIGREPESNDDPVEGDTLGPEDGEDEATIDEDLADSEGFAPY